MAEFENVDWDTPKSSSSKEKEFLQDELTDEQLGNEESSSPNATSALNNVQFPPPNVIKVIVGQPEKESDGAKDPHITYLLTTTTSLPSYSKKEFTKRRRFQDFSALHDLLWSEYPAVILPPLPEKHRLEYLTGDRFSTDFVEKRMRSLQTFMDRLVEHPVLYKCDWLRVFLESDNWNAAAIRKHKKESLLESITDSILNARGKVKKPDERFLEVREGALKVEQSLNILEKVFHQLTKKQTDNFIVQYEDLYMNYSEFAVGLLSLGELETTLTDEFQIVGKAAEKSSLVLSNLNEKVDMEFLLFIRDYLSYLGSVKDVLKMREQKQLEHEDLIKFLNNQVSEKQKLLNPALRGSGLGTFIREKYDEMKGLNNEIARKERLEKVEGKIKELEEAVQESKEVSSVFSEEALKEYAVFQKRRVESFKNALQEYVNGHVQYYKESYEVWDTLVHQLESSEV